MGTTRMKKTTRISMLVLAIYFIVVAFLSNRMITGEGGAGLGAYLELLVFQTIFAVVAISYLVFNKVRQATKNNSINLIAYVLAVGPVVTYFIVSSI